MGVSNVTQNEFPMNVFYSFVNLDLISVDHRVSTRPEKPLNPGNFLEFLSVLESVLEFSIFRVLSWNFFVQFTNFFSQLLFLYFEWLIGSE